MSDLHVCEIFKSIQGESTFAGLACSFVRLSGCNLSCAYCDTAYAKNGTAYSLDDIICTIQEHQTGIVEITGGEPLLQESTPQLCRRFLDLGYTVLIETNGSIDIASVPEGCRCIVDVKCPGSGMAGSFNIVNFQRLKEGDELKYVIASQSDFYWALSQVVTEELHKKVPVLFSPVWETVQPAMLASWILAENAPVRLGLQLHKIIWGDKQGV